MTYQQPYPSDQPAYKAEPPLWAPYYGAPFPAALQRFFKKYATFNGRASRSEYWWWTLASVVVSVLLNVIIGSGTTTTAYGTTTGPGTVIGGILAVVWGLATIVPSLALSVRRLHDVNMSGWMLLIVLVPFLGALALLVFMVLPSNPAGQRFDRPVGAPLYPAR
ncbi:DUF805 domain-containing protein [Arthrobacter sp. B3I4]|uniref:DUF805 domain-containing protein n=1 Tax=Arthrobacter sp. B3I4 TaxID=3042267 RepID=UPI00277DF9BB|nr:DUF805 domain-containing protein [Arthrobacter sp. B3I4]MDQ0754227.1 uncharacterized membrane protein YhaH (DUF805 family) [Arthrobacter sp. B3I4]